MRAVTRSALTGLFVLSTLASRAARAQDPIAAEALFREGSALWQEGKTAAACERFARSNEAQPGVGTLFFLADCAVRSGKRATGWYRLREAVTLAASKGDTSREQLAEARSRELEHTLPHLVLRAADPPMPAQTVIRRDDVNADSSSLDVPVPMDPGAHHIEVSAPGYRPWGVDVVVPDSPATVSVNVPRLEKSLAAAGPLPSRTPEAPSPPPPRPEEPSPAPRITAGVVAVAGIAVGTTLGILATTTWGDVRGACPDRTCPTAAVQTTMTSKQYLAETEANVATGAFVVAGVAVVVLVATYLLHPSAKQRAANLLAPAPTFWF